MNRGCVFASRDLARCGTLQKCGQAAAAAAAVAAETERQEHSPPASPASQRCGGTPGESLQTSSGRGEDAGSPSGRAGERAGGSPSPGVPSLPVPPPPQDWPPRLAGARAWGGEVALGGHLAFAPGAPGWRVARLFPLAFPSPAASCLGSFLSGIITSSPPLPQVTARARAAAPPGHFPGPSGGAFLCGRFSTEAFKLFTKFLEGQDAKEPRRCFLPAAASRFFFAVDLFPGGV
ncbi:SWI/SNF complex subunit SMARCC2-like [Lemur catta]|uniref:SWI/SNF complex subunit SMARCC2-like n=1 Tax=Lemur catta TaxID=9447 RepID=UPI001E2667F1|nr:SWI/SNF complex subunit SMARCC2-like [Lemur catta]